MISVVIPVFNEEASIPVLHDSLEAALGVASFDYEIIFVDDGSRDGSLQALKTLASRYSHVRVIQLSKNFGQSAAMSAGIDAAQGEYIVTMDADMQNDPEDIPRLYAHLQETEADIVSGWRKNRKDSYLSRVFVSNVANALISKITKVHLHDYGCTLKIYRAEVIKKVQLYGELHRFLPALASWQGAKIEELVVNHHPRTLGKSKYGLTRIYRVLFDLLSVKYYLAYQAKPLHFFGTMGFFIMLPGLLVGSIISFQRLVFAADISPRIPSLIFAAISVLMGVQVMMFGLLADLIVRTSKQTSPTTNRHYLVKEVIET